MSENNRRARFYELTGKGHRALANEAESWTTYAAAVQQVLHAAAPAPKASDGAAVDGGAADPRAVHRKASSEP